MATREREREILDRIDRENLRPQGGTRKKRVRDYEPDVKIAYEPQPKKVNGSSEIAAIDMKAGTFSYKAPSWVMRLLPVGFSERDLKKKCLGRNCCLFNPLNLCNEEVINGFCTFHLRAIFNITYMNKPYFAVDGKNAAKIMYKGTMFVADPRPIDDRMVPCFPFFELFEETPTMADIQLENLYRYLQSINATDIKEKYDKHVRFLYTLVRQFSMPPPELKEQLSREDAATEAKMYSHWLAWNEYYSRRLMLNPANIVFFCPLAGKGKQIQIVPLSKCTTMTQMVVRMLKSSCTSKDEPRFYTMPPSYGVFVKGHITYSDNLCCFGTTVLKDNLTTIGNMITFPLMRLDSEKKKRLFEYEPTVMCNDDICISTKMKMEDDESDNEIPDR